MSGQPINNPFRRMTPQNYNYNDQVEDNYGGYDLDEDPYDNSASQPSQRSGGFTMSDNRQSNQQSSGLVINKPNFNQEEASPAPKQYANNQLGAYSQGQKKPPVKSPFKPPIRPNPFQNRAPAGQVHNNPFANKSPGSGQQENEDSPYPVNTGKRDSVVNLDDEGTSYDYDEPHFEEVSQSQPTHYSANRGHQKAKKIEMHNPFQDRQESPSAPSSGFSNDRGGKSAKQIDHSDTSRQPDPGFYDNKVANQNDPYADEPSILEELEIDPAKIRQKFLAILTYRGLSNMEVALYHDMAGPLLVIFLFGMSFIFKGRMEFGNIYGFSLTGCIGLYCIINLLSKPGQYAELYSCISILGYSLLPFCFLALISIFIQMNNAVGYCVCAFFVFWSTATATKMFEFTLDMEDKKFLIGYPIILFYGIFVQLTVL